ncbi:helix-turn-helix transcriptional regulator [Burkholderia cepacia]|uniref:helix-turn-helix transcriptional regulator n=1 Tax=Burkholderia cepacia TaxID=292 RepID=UPI0022AAEA88|nr:AlpA family phage regulatory protein [Burkholderia cepacia]
MSNRTERLLRLPTVLEMVGLGKTTIYDMMKAGEFPKPRRVRNLSLWVESEVQGWIREISSHSVSANR